MTENGWQRPDEPRKCTYRPGDNLENCPHFLAPLRPKRSNVSSSVTDLILDTPLVRLNHIPKSEGLKCEILVKCEFLNPGGSVKDRIALRMIEQAEKDGILQPGDTIIEPTSGNTGIGLAMVAAQKKYKCIIVMPEKMSAEKEIVLRALGAEIVRTPTGAKYDEKDSHLRVADALKVKLGPRAHILNQYINPYNPIEHFDQTGREIVRDCKESGREIDIIVVGAGTAGTVTGISSRIRLDMPSCRIIAVEPEGSTLGDRAGLLEPKSYEVEGIGYDFCPSVLNHHAVDRWMFVTDRESFLMARRLIREEGLLCGGSSGSAVHAAIETAKLEGIGEGKTIVVILPDSIRNYLTKFASDAWMYSHGYIDYPSGSCFCSQWKSEKVSECVRSIGKTETVRSDMCIREAVEKLKKLNLHRLVVLDSKDSHIVGVFDNRALQDLLDGSVTPQDPVSKCMTKDVRQLSFDIEIEELGRRLMIEPCVIFKHETGIWLVDQDDFFQWTVLRTKF